MFIKISLVFLKYIVAANSMFWQYFIGSLLL